jgi:hypothetical protein
MRQDELETEGRLTRLEVQMESALTGLATLTTDVRSLVETSAGDRKFAKGIFVALCVLWTIGTFVTPLILSPKPEHVADRVKMLEAWAAGQQADKKP